MAISNKNPELGYGGADYNTAEAEMRRRIAQNQANIANNQAHKDSEIQRALQVIANREKQGLDTSAQQKYLNTNLGYKPSTTNATPTTTPSPTPTATQSTPKPTQQSSDLMDMMRQIATRETTPFSYDPNSDPAYQAALQRARTNIDQGNSAAQAEMNRRGILNSTITSDRMGEIAASEMGRVETDVLPALMQQAYQKYLDQENMKNQQLANIGNVAQMYISEDQRGIDNTNTRAQLTGYLPGGEQAQGLVNQLMGLKQQAEAKGITAAERTKLSNQADGIRAMLAQMGVDASQYGANVNYNTASQIAPTIRTIQGQQLDMSKQGQAFDQQFTQEQFAYQKVRDAISDKRWQMEFDEAVRQNGLNYGLNVLKERNQTAYQEAQLALAQDDNSRMWAQLDWDMSRPSSGSTGGLTANQVLQSMKDLYTVPTFTKDELGNQTKTGSKITSEPAQREEMFLQVVDAGLSDSETKQILSSLGLTKSEITEYTKKYGANSGN